MLTSELVFLFTFNTFDESIFFSIFSIAKRIDKSYFILLNIC